MTVADNLETIDSLVIRWMKTVWESILEQMVCKSFLKCDISNKMDGTEMMSCILLGKVLLKLRMWRITTAMLNIMTILLLQWDSELWMGQLFHAWQEWFWFWGNLIILLLMFVIQYVPFILRTSITQNHILHRDWD